MVNTCLAFITSWLLSFQGQRASKRDMLLQSLQGQSVTVPSLMHLSNFGAAGHNRKYREMIPVADQKLSRYVHILSRSVTKLT